MPFWKRKVDPELEAAEMEAENALPAGWQIDRVDPETYWVPTGRVLTYGITASGPGDEKLLVVAVGEVNAYRQFVRGLRGELEKSEAWALPLDGLEPKEMTRSGRVWDEENSAVVAARDALEAELPSGWHVSFTDREKYKFSDVFLPVFAVSVAGPGGEAELVLGLGETAAYEQMVRRLRGELEITEAWVPPLDNLIPR